MRETEALGVTVTRRMQRSRSDAIQRILSAASAPGILSMAGGIPAPQTFPVDRIAEATRRVLSRSAASALQYAATAGVPAMRELLASRASATGAARDADEVIVTSGSQQGLDLLTTALVEEGDVVALEDPSYLGAAQTFRRAGARLLAVPGDRDGMDTSALERAIAGGVRCTLVYVVPHFHNPSGAVLSAERRLHLARLAERYGFVVVEDDPYADLSFDGERQRSIDTSTGRVIRLMSLSKVLCPGLRVAGLAAPRGIAAEIARAKQCADLQTSTFDQYVIAELLADPAFLPAHVAGLRSFYRDRADRLASLLGEQAPELRFQRPRGGLFLWCELVDPAHDSESLLSAAIECGVAVVPGAPFCIERDGGRYVRLSYATLDHDQTVEAVHRLTRALSHLSTRHARSGGTGSSDLTTPGKASSRREPATAARPREERLTGWSGGSDYFTFREQDGYDARSVVDVLRGRVAGAMFRGMMAPETCAALAARFWASPARRVRGSEAPGYYVGAYHYHRTTEEYLADSERVAAALDEVLAVPGDPLDRFYRELAGALAPEGVTVRRARHGDRLACRGLLRSWHGEGEFALAPHEDLSQCTEPKQVDFEIQRVVAHHGVALNMCIENGSSGRLAYWNIRPDIVSRRRLGVHYTGSPYPADVLDGIEMMWVDVHPGDVYVFNGAHVHAVEPTRSGERRTTLAGILGFIDDTTVVSWT
ncbi:MAG: PLP-dependent aminotransferase family protein [Frankiaceae bacterium]